MRFAVVSHLVKSLQPEAASPLALSGSSSLISVARSTSCVTMHRHTCAGIENEHGNQDSLHMHSSRHTRKILKFYVVRCTVASSCCSFCSSFCKGSFSETTLVWTLSSSDFSASLSASSLRRKGNKCIHVCLHVRMGLDTCLSHFHALRQERMQLQDFITVHKFYRAIACLQDDILPCKSRS